MRDIDQALGRKVRYEIPTPRPSYLRNYAQDVVPVSLWPWRGSIKMLGIPTLRSILRTDLTLIFDAILFDRALFNPLFNFLSTLYLLLPIARRYGKRMGCYNVGLGPVHTRAGRQMLRKVLSLMDFVTLRDQESFDLFKNLGLDAARVRITADAALNAPPAPNDRVEAILRTAGLEPGQPLLGININRYLDTWASPDRRSMGRERFLRTYAEALQQVWRETRVPLVFVCTQHHDVPITRELMKRLAGVPCALVANRDYNHAEIRGVLGRLELHCGMRLHSLILAAAACTPIVGVAYQPKVTYFMNLVGLGEHLVSFDEFSPQRLAGAILRAWQHRAEIRRRLEDRIPLLAREASRPASLVVALDRGEDVGAVLSSWPLGYS